MNTKNNTSIVIWAIKLCHVDFKPIQSTSNDIGSGDASMKAASCRAITPFPINTKDKPTRRYVVTEKNRSNRKLYRVTNHYPSDDT